MNVYVSWAYTATAAKAEERRVTWIESLGPKKDAELIKKCTVERCLPEYADYTEYCRGDDDDSQFDELNQDMLAIRFLVPGLARTVTYQLDKRMPGSGKLPASLAARSFLLKTFEGEWGHNSAKPAGNVTFIGFEGVCQFLYQLQACCAALGSPLPVSFAESPKLVLPPDAQVRLLVDAAAYNCKDNSQQSKYVDMLTGWMGTGSSASRDGKLALTTGMLFGREEREEDGSN